MLTLATEPVEVQVMSGSSPTSQFWPPLGAVTVTVLPPADGLTLSREKV